MAIRSIASLSLTFGLVSIPVKVYLATESSAAIKFKLMAASGARVRQQYVAADLPTTPSERRPSDDDGTADELPRAPERSAMVSPLRPGSSRSLAVEEEPESEDEPHVLERAEMVKGYEFEKGQFVLFTADELKALEAESRHTIDIVSFIPEQSVDPIYFDKAYYLAPDKRGGKPYSLLRRAMQQTHRCALAKWAWRSKEYVVQIRAVESGMVLQQLL
jgi:DNA end-binding protein Ku